MIISVMSVLNRVNKKKNTFYVNILLLLTTAMILVLVFFSLYSYRMYNVYRVTCLILNNALSTSTNG